MIAHLSSEQLAEWIAGQPSLMVAQHVRECPACRAELADFRETLGDFRGAVRAWSEDQAGKYLENAACSNPSALREPVSRLALNRLALNRMGLNRMGLNPMVSHQLAWALLLAAVCVVASFILPRPAADEAFGRDAVLLNQVDAQVSRTVPSSMEPLMKLVVQQ
jgi:anti-sigma factor RsiW